MAQISDAVRNILWDATVDGRTIVLPPRLNRDDYVAVNKVLENMGGKWSRKDKAHVFPSDPAPMLATILADGTFTDRKKELQFFPTPPHLAELMVGVADITHGDCVLEPSAGHGAIVREIMKKTPRVVAVEIDAENCRQISWKCDYVAPIQADFLKWAEDMDGVEFDRVVMNPPFSGGQDIAHVMAAWSLLKPGGRLVAITSPGWKFRTTKPYAPFRSWLEDLGAITEDLPAGTFKEAGTDVATTMIIAKKEN